MTKPKTHSHTSAIFIALLVTFLWSTSFIIIKLGLGEIPPLTFAGLRYTIAFMCLLPFALKKERIEEIKKIEKRDWLKLIALGFIFYTFTQGTQFLGLSLLPAVTVSLILNFTPVVVAVMGILLLSEIPSVRQWFGAFLFIAGVMVYFFPADLSASKITGLIVMSVGVIANASSSILGRSVNRGGKFHPLTVTIISMGVGSIVLLVVGIAVQGFPAIGLMNILFLLWLAGINTALAFTLWNLSLRSLTAMESSIINGTMLIQIAILAWVFLGETITLKEFAGMLIAAAGALLVQLKKK
ncbi:MAG: DMT family transporter [Ignavibacteriales bacterium]|nr:DMT family transporter [Ignavibacteriales bacterium]